MASHLVSLKFLSKHQRPSIVNLKDQSKMGGSLEAFKIFLASEKKRHDRADQRLAEQQANKSVDGVNVNSSNTSTTTSATGSPQVQTIKAETSTTSQVKAEQ